MKTTPEITRKCRFTITGDAYPLIISDVKFGVDRIDLDDENNPYAAEMRMYLHAEKIDGSWVLCADVKWDRSQLEAQVSEGKLKKIRHQAKHIYQCDLTMEMPTKSYGLLPFDYSGDCGHYATTGGFYPEFTELLSERIEQCVSDKSAGFDTGWHGFKKSKCSLNISVRGRFVSIEVSAYVSDEHHETLDSVCYEIWNKSLSEMEESKEFNAYKEEYGFNSIDDVTDFLLDVVMETSEDANCFQVWSTRVNGPYSKALPNRVLRRAVSAMENAMGAADRNFRELCDRIKSIVVCDTQDIPG